MGELGSIFDEAPATHGGAKGPDLRVQATVRRAELEAGRPVLVSVPDHVAFEGGTVPRHREVGDPSGEIRLHLSPQLASGAVLRLRRQGGEHPESGTPGDLLVELTVVQARRLPWVAVVVVLAAAAAAAAAAFGWSSWSG